MNKTYEAKIYNIDGSPKTIGLTLPKSEIISNFTFTSQINGGQGEGIFELDKLFSDTTYLNGDIIKVYCFSDLYSNGLLIYTGMINRIRRKLTKGIESIELSTLGLANILNFIYFYQGAYVFNKNQDPAQTIKDIVDYFNTKYNGSWFSYSGGNITNYGSSINKDFDYKKSLDSIKEITSTTNFWYYIGPDGQVYFKGFPVNSTHTLTIEKDVEELIIQEDVERVINKHITIYKTGTNTPSINGSSQTQYGLRELKEDKTDIVDIASATIYSDNYILKNKDFKNKISIILNNKYNIENIKPGDTVSVKNINYSINNVQINKITYTYDKVKLELSEFDTIGKEIFN